MRFNPFSVRSLSLFVAGVALVAAACSDDESAPVAAVTQMSVKIGSRAPVVVPTTGATFTIPIGNHADTIVQVTFLRADGSADPVVIPGQGWTTTATSSSPAVIVTARTGIDNFGYVIKATSAVSGGQVDFSLKNPEGTVVFGPVPVKFSTP